MLFKRLSGGARRALIGGGALVALVGTALLSGPAAADEFLATTDASLVTTQSGQLVGGLRNAIHNYRGIPYATAERFAAPEKVAAWEGARPAVTYGESCPIATMDAVANDELFNPHRYLPESENCQFLNIWTPGIADGAKRPVMVWLHGGGFSNGSAIEQLAYDGENLSKKGDVVVVSLNHRLNVLGYLDLTAYGDAFPDTANVGMADIVAALEWVRDNIEAFGGDPDNVTIFGQSGGGSKVRTLMGMPAADGLFDRAIVQSGATRSPVIPQEASRRVAELTLANLGLTAETVGEIRSVPYEDLLAAGDKAFEQAVEEGVASRVAWAPFIDGARIPQNPVGDAWVEQASDIPLLIGTVLNESESVISHPPAELFADNKNGWSDEKARVKLAERFGDKSEAVAAAFLEAYPEKKLADAYFVDLSGRPGTLRNTMLKAEQGGAPVYSYVFTWESPVMEGIGMSWHCSEIPHVFANAGLVDTATGGGADALAMSDRMSQAWINFARSGDPNHEGLPDWPAFTVENGATMIFDNTSEVRFHHDQNLLQAAGAVSG